METLVLRDIHQPAVPSWWPPAPGWWLLLAVLVLAAAMLVFFRLRRWRRKRAWARLFDASLAETGSPSERIGAMSALLRRAARMRSPAADKLQGDRWLAFVNDEPGLPALTPELGQLLLEGGFRPDVDETRLRELQQAVRARFLLWTGARR